VKALIEKISTSGPDNIVKLDTIITEINKIQKMELQNSAGLQPQSRVINQNKIRMSQTLVSNTLMELNSDQNDSWETFIKVCIDFENIIPETKFITRLPLNKQMEYADKIRDFSDVDNTQSLALAVACVLKALSTPNSVDKAFGDTTALKQFLDKFNSGQIDGDVRSVIYQIVEQKEGTELTVEHYAAQEEKITQMTDIALEQGFEVIYSDLQSRA